MNQRLPRRPGGFLKVRLAFLLLMAVGTLWSQCPIPSVTQTTTPTCGGTAVLTASGSTGLFRWYTASVGGSPVFTGTAYTTPAIFFPTTFFVEAVDNLSSPTCSSGRIAVVASANALPSPVVNPINTSCGANVTINASSTTNIHRWFRNANGTNLVSTATNYPYGTVVGATDTLWVQSATSTSSVSSQTFNFTGNVQQFIVPQGVTSVTVDLQGAQGGSNGSNVGGNGGRVVTNLQVTPGETLWVYVGGQGQSLIGGWNGGGASSDLNSRGGGGASDIRRGGQSLQDRLLVAGGGGGSGWSCSNGHNGGIGGTTGGNGSSCGSLSLGCQSGMGATQTAAGSAPCVGGPTIGLLGLGGSGNINSAGNGGGGGGWFGGGGGNSNHAGGGGSSNAHPSISNVTYTNGFRTGNGVVIFTWNNASVCYSSLVPAVVSASTLSPPTITPTVSGTCGDQLTLTASGGGASNYVWYTQQNGGTPFHTSASLTNTFASNATYWVGVRQSSPTPQTSTFNFTGSPTTWTVPNGVFEIQVDVRGAQGGTGSWGTGGLGGRVAATIPVTPGEVLQINVGQQGTTSNVFGGGGTFGISSNARGGGGASDIRQGGTDLTNRIIVAGGGGGAGGSSFSNSHGGPGGGLVGGTGFRGNSNTSGWGGTGGSQTDGGLVPNNTSSGSNGSFGQGGNGTTFGGGSGNGGGGGGWFGGAGGMENGGGGGGSSFITPLATNITNQQGTQSGNGQVIITWMPATCESARVPVDVTLNPITLTNVISDTVNCGGAAQLIATASSGAQTEWFNSPTSTTPFLLSPVNNLTNVTAPDTFYVRAKRTTTLTQTFNFTGGAQSFVVPAGVSSIQFDVQGAQGGTNGSNQGGLGARVTGRFNVVPGQTLWFVVGGQGSNVGGFNGGGNPGASGSSRGGGGASDIRTAPNDLNQRLVVAAGGGGCGWNCGSSDFGGNGGALVGSPGRQCNNIDPTCNSGLGGSQTTPGNSSCNTSVTTGGFGFGGNGLSSSNSGGGGGGWFGGGGASSTFGGGGGSSYADANLVSLESMAGGVRNGNGVITITYSIDCLSGPLQPIAVVVDSLPAPTVTGGQTACAPVNAALLASGGSGTYQWFTQTNPGAPVIASGAAFSPVVTQNTTYYARYVDNIGCVSKWAPVQVNALPVPDATIQPFSLVCSSQPAFNAQAATQGGTWSGPGILNASTGLLDPSVLTPGNYQLLYTVTSNGCTDADSIVYTVDVSPTVSILSTPASYCNTGATVALQATPAGGNWVGTGVSSSGSLDPALLTPGSNVLRYQFLAPNGCVGEDSLAVVLNLTPNPSFTTPATQFCTSQAPAAFVPSTSGGTWSGVGINPSTGVFNPGLAPVGTQTLRYSVTQNGCSSSDSVVVTVSQGPSVTISGAQPSVCVNGASLNLTAATSGGVWSGNGILNGANGVFQPAQAGAGTAVVRYNLQAGSCLATDSVVIQVNPLPVVAVSPAGLLTACQGTPASFTATGGNTYQWRFSGANVQGAVSGTFFPTQPGNYDVVVTDANGCSVSSSPLVFVEQAKPVIAALQTPAVCQGNATNFGAQASVNGANGAAITNYFWSFGDGGNATGATPVYAYSAPGSYTATLVVQTNQGCSDTLSQAVAVNPSPVIGSVTAPSVCLGSAANFSGNATVANLNGAQISQTQWNLGSGILAQGNNVSQVFNAPGTYHYTFTAITNQGCSASQSGSMNIWQVPNVSFDASIACSGSPVVFANGSDNGNYTWIFGDGNSSNLAAPTHVYSTDGVFNVSLTVQSPQGCQNTAVQQVQVLAGPSATWVSSSTGGGNVLFTPTAFLPGQTVVWNFGDGTLSSDINPSKTYAAPGTYNVCLTVSTSNGCTTTLCNDVIVSFSASTETIGQANITAYPNPFASYFEVTMDMPTSESAILKLTDVTGKVVYQGEWPAGTTSMNVPVALLGLSNGTYVLSVSSGSMLWTNQMILIR